MSSTVNVLGHQMILDSTDSLELGKRGVYEPFVTELVESRLRRGDICVDVGAHIGYHTLLMARAVGPTGHVYAFEPHPGNHALLQQNVKLNGYEHITVRDEALSHRAGKANLYLCDFSTGGHRLWDPEPDYSWPHIEVDTVRLDDCIPQVDFIKIDAEGYEYWVVEGASRLLEADQPMSMLMEFWPSEIRKNGGHPERLLEWLVYLGFALWRVAEMNHGPLSPTDIEGIMRYEVSGGWVYLWLQR